MSVRQILVSAIGLTLIGVGLSACGQKGPLYLPTDPAARNRATLPQTLTPGRNATDDPAAPPSTKDAK
jgi:predicted small lipoprotein YifL